jgi:long-chain acyl-CoA synthetase
MFTSGTSNLAKGVILSHDNINNATNNINEFIGNDSSDTEILVVPIHHSFGMARLRCVLSSGGTLVLVKSLVNIKRIFRIFSETKITGIGMVPSSWSYLKKMSGNKIIEKFQNLKYIEFGSAFMSEFEKKELVILFPETKICMHYGLTEASRSCFLDFKSDYNYLYSVGIPSSRTKIITIDPKNNKRLERGEIGENCISGPHVSKGYLNVNKDEVFYDDYIRTGDLGFIDKNGYLVLEGRLKDIINIGGKKVSPLEIEEKIYEFNNKIKSACVGIKDNNNVLGEVIKVFIEKDSYDGSFT